MKLADAIELGGNRNWMSADIRKNPSAPSQWFVMLVDKNEIPHMLVDDSERPLIREQIDGFVDVLRTVGVREFTVHL